MKKKQLPREAKAEPESYYFDLQASWGLTKHMWGLEATRELIDAGHIDKIHMFWMSVAVLE
jgi:outer membrane PBP1 activator LpoA protein